MKRSKLFFTAAIVVLALGSAVASNNAVKKVINNPFYTTDGGITFKQFVQNNVPCQTGASGCIQNVGADGLQQLYATASLSTPLRND